MTNKQESEEDVLLKEKTLLENDYSFEIRFSKFTNTFQSKAGSYITVLKMSVKPNQILDFISFEKRVSYQQGFEAGKIVEKDTNSQDSIQVGNESIQTNTLGTTMEEIEDKITRELDVLENAIGDENRELAICSREHLWTLIYNLIAQSKTDLLNALIEREDGMKIPKENYKKVVDGKTSTNPEFMGYNKALDDTINHLKSLRDEI